MSARPMTVTLNDILLLAGRLQDGAGFDAPRERFRRFLLDHVTDAHVARGLIEQCQHAPGDQHHRALHDMVVVLGRSLGFEARFTSHLPAGAPWNADGHWHSRRLDVVLEIRTDQTRSAELDTLLQSVATLAPSAPQAQATRTIGLSVVTPLYTGFGRLDELQSSDRADARARIVSLKSLLTFADLIGARSLTHDDFVRLLGSGLSLDFVAGLLERAAGGPVRPVLADHAETPAIPAPDCPSFWLATIGSDQGTTADRFIEAVIGKRRVFGVESGTPDAGTVRPGDGLCFYVPGKGIVGHGHAGATSEAGGAIRAAHRFSQLVHLDDLVLHVATPGPLDDAMQLRVRAARTGGESAHTITRISKEEFEAVAAARRLDERRAEEIPTQRDESEPWGIAVTAGDSHLRE